MYLPKFIITPEILKNIGAIEAAKAVLEKAPLVPSYEKSFQDEAVLRTVHFGTRIEGNELSLNQAAQAIAGREVLAGHRAVQEVINYREVVDFIDELGKKRKGQFFYEEKDFLKIHALVCNRILPPKKCGRYRQTAVVVRSPVGETVFKAPPAIEVPYLVRSFFAFLNSQKGREVHPVLRAGIAHYVLVAIHPFVEGNGRTARAFANLILFVEGYDVRRLFSLEEYFDKNLNDYYYFLKKTSDQSPDLAKRDLTAWLGFFSRGLAEELTRVKEQVEKLSVDQSLRQKLGGKQIALSARQVKLMEQVNQKGGIDMNTARQVLPMVSDDTILRELQDLRKKGIIRKVGRTKGVRYVLR